MSVSKVIRKFSKVSEEVDKYNSKNRSKRFFSMTHQFYGKTVEVGIYDSVKKRYVVTDVRAYNALDTVDEMRMVLARA